MAQAIAAELATAMESIDRRPIVRISTDSVTAPIPFSGSPLTPGTGDFGNVGAGTLADGRIVVAYMQFAYEVVVGISNVERTQLTNYVFTDFGDAIGVSVVPLIDGNIGLIVTAETYDPSWAIVSTATGELLFSGVLTGDPIEYYASATRLANDTYVVIYIFGDNLWYQTSSDFQTWTSRAISNITGLSFEFGAYEPFIVSDPNGELSLFLTYVNAVSGADQLTNIYHFISTDGGVNWSPASGTPGADGKVTEYESYSPVASGATAALRSSGSTQLLYNEVNTVLFMDKNTSGWYGTGSSAFWNDVEYMYFDVTTRKLIVMCMQTNLVLKGIQVIDVDTWQVDKCIYDLSIPTLSAMWWTEYPYIGHNTIHSEGGLFGLISKNQNGHIAIYDIAGDSVKEFHFNDWVEYGIEANTGPIPLGHMGGILGMQPLTMNGAWIDSASNRLYLIFSKFYVYGSAVSVGYIDLDSPGPSYQYNQVIAENVHGGGVKSEAQVMALTTSGMPVQVYPNEGLLVVTAGHNLNISNFSGYTRLYSLTSWATVRDYDIAIDGNYPLRGLRECIIAGGVLYGGFTYCPDYGEDGKRGLWSVRISDNQSAYLMPTFYSRNDYGWKDVIYDQDSNTLFWASTTDGIISLALDGLVWNVYNNGTVPGMLNSADAVAFDPVNDMIYAGNPYGLYATSIFGELIQPHYIDIVSLGGGVYSYSAPLPLVQGYRDWGAIAVFPGTSAHYFWTRLADSLTVMQGQDEVSFRVDELLAGGTSLSIKRSIDGKPNQLEFTVTHGHLFDPHNRSSLWSAKLAKYRRVEVQFGEIVNGYEVLHPAGAFIIMQGKMNYARGAYPTFHVTAEDKRALWEHQDVIATEAFEATPEFIVDAVLEDHAGLSPAEVDIPVLAGSYEIHFQWLDSSVKKIVEEVLNRFGYYSVVTVGDIVSARPISVSNPIDRTAVAPSMIVEFSPDDSFSDMTNRIVVTGESRDFHEVVYVEETVGPMVMGTTGWWGGGETKTVWYSEDHKRRCRNPRLETLSPGAVALGIVPTAAIIFVDVNEHYCIVEISNPNLIPEIVAAIMAMVATGISCGMTKFVSGYCFMAWVIELSLLMYLVCTVGQYQFQVHAQPYGEERLGVRAQVDDEEFQGILGRVVEKKLEEPLCISPGQCQEVGEHEMMLIRAQRNRVTLIKTGDLRDEEGDTLVLQHPYTKEDFKIFITDLKREFHVPNDPVDDRAGLFDSVEGWIL